MTPTIFFAGHLDEFNSAIATWLTERHPPRCGQVKRQLSDVFFASGNFAERQNPKKTCHPEERASLRSEGPQTETSRKFLKLRS